MVNGLNATTSQLKFVERLIEAYATCDLNNVEPFLSKNFKYQTFPRAAHLPDHTKGDHVEKFGPVFAAMSEIEYFIHEVIEAPGKVVLQWTALCIPRGGVTVEYESIAILALVEEDGETKLLGYKEFSDPEKRSNFHNVLVKAGEIV